MRAAAAAEDVAGSREWPHCLPVIVLGASVDVSHRLEIQGDWEHPNRIEAASVRE